MARGKKKTQTVEPKSEEARKNNTKKETKENKHETCQGQSSIHAFLSPNKPRRESPLFPLQEDNSVPCTVLPGSDKQINVKLTVGSSESNTPKQESSCTQSSSCEPKDGLDHPHQEDATSDVAAVNTANKGSQSKVKWSKPTQKKAEGKDSQRNRKVTDYFPIRRSSRKSKAELKHEELRHIDDLITNNVEEGLKMKHIEGKGRGVFADRDFRKGQFVVEYHGDLLQIDDAKSREALYAEDPATGCYMYYFQYHNKTYCIDATKETGRLGRLINHSKSGNCQTRLHDLNGVPHLILVASRDVTSGEELLYDYGDRSRDAIAAHPWLKH